MSSEPQARANRVVDSPDPIPVARWTKPVNQTGIVSSNRFQAVPEMSSQSRPRNDGSSQDGAWKRAAYRSASSVS